MLLLDLMTRDHRREREDGKEELKTGNGNLFCDEVTLPSTSAAFTCPTEPSSVVCIVTARPGRN
jgi:hypothetical protein